VWVEYGTGEWVDSHGEGGPGVVGDFEAGGLGAVEAGGFGNDCLGVLEEVFEGGREVGEVESFFLEVGWNDSPL